MRINKKLAVILPLVSILFSCGGNSGYSKYLIRNVGSNVVYSDTEKNTYIEKYIPKIQEFSERFASEFAKGKNIKENIASSPLSVFLALAIAAECTAGETRQEILEALGMTIEEVRECASMIYNIQNKVIENTDGTTKVVSKESITNSLWMVPGFHKKKETINTLAKDYYCYPFEADFEKNNSAANDAVNSFIKEKTFGLIDGIEISELTRMIILNTLYLNDSWNLGADLTYMKDPIAFANSDSSFTNTKLLQAKRAEGRVYEEDLFTHFYVETTNHYKLKFIVPKDEYSVDQVFTKENISKIGRMSDYRVTDETYKYYTTVKFPEFIAESTDLVDNLLADEFKIQNLFDKEKCDFSSLTNDFETEKPIVSVLHKVKVDVNKKGVEAAGITSISISTDAADILTPIISDYVVDRAFGYVITDSNNIPLFSGIVNDLSK